MLPIAIITLAAGLCQHAPDASDLRTPLHARLLNQSAQTGMPDPSTNDTHLRLRTGDADAYIIHGIPWEQIAQVQYKSNVWEPARFDELRQEIRREAEARLRSADHQLDQLDPGGNDAKQAGSHSTRPLWQPSARSAPHESRSDQVRFIEIDATAANWDADPAWDGIVVRVWPMDQNGNVVEVAGTCTAILTGTVYETYAAAARLGHWVQPVRASHYGGDGFSLRLEFQSHDPDRVGRDAGARVDPAGEVHVTFAVPGHGVFRASAGPIRLRRFSPQRDRLERLGVVAPADMR